MILGIVAIGYYNNAPASTPTLDLVYTAAQPGAVSTPDVKPGTEDSPIGKALLVGFGGGCANGQCGNGGCGITVPVEALATKKTVERSVKRTVTTEATGVASADGGRRHIARGALRSIREAKPVRRLLGRLFCRRR